MLQFSAIVWNAQAAKVRQAGDNCDVTMVAALRLSNTKVRDLQQVGECIFAPLVSCLEARWRARAIAPLKPKVWLCYLDFTHFRTCSQQG